MDLSSVDGDLDGLWNSQLDFLEDLQHVERVRRGVKRLVRGR